MTHAHEKDEVVPQGKIAFLLQADVDLPKGTVLYANSGKDLLLPEAFHTATGEIHGMQVEAKSQCPQRANSLIGAFMNTIPEEGFQRASMATYNAMDLAVAGGCAAEVRVFKHS